MRKILTILSLSILVFSCASGGKVMTAESFSEVSIGMSSDEMQKKFGKPYSIKDLGEGEVEYTYIEKIHMGSRVLQERHYLIILKNGRVTATKTRDYSRPAWQRNSYEMQTSYNKEEKEAIKQE
ncbi:MAG: hypothetical protein K940chlam1_01149 [Candidatus Anoxychlamydiales bacterium]|nr:hypothetical protein [Candidatus Anoxychlamydiales bacterium]NGX36542.1 hypothetical protein [Candidatus Anoxychlamydiales bacterium]